MRLKRFGVQNFRSITKAQDIPLKEYTVLVGPNNEGKSNLLLALVTGLRLVQAYVPKRPFGARPGSMFLRVMGKTAYSWERDYPIHLQEEEKGETIFNYDFDLDAIDSEEFYKDVQSKINGDLSIQIRVGKDGIPKFKVLKKRGRGATTLADKAGEISAFLQEKIEVQYIAAVRTAGSAMAVVEKMAERALQKLEDDPKFNAALKVIADLQKPHLEQLSKEVKEMLQAFLPSVKDAKIIVSNENRLKALRNTEIIVDDGHPTALAAKGDGVQSLAALSLIKASHEQGKKSGRLIFAIEEPEAHLHPKAVSQLKDVLRNISKKSGQQVIISTHSPLLVERGAEAANIIVKSSKATVAKNVSEIRDILGIAAADNLTSAELALVVEGEVRIPGQGDHLFRPIVTTHSGAR